MQSPLPYDDWLRPVLVIVALSIVPSTAFAYVDPGAGALVIQLVLSAAIGAVVYIRRLRATAIRAWEALTGRFRSVTRDASEGSGAGSDPR